MKYLLLLNRIYQKYFLEAKQEFKETYEKSVYFKTIQGLTNSVIATMDLYMLHNMYYEAYINPLL